MWTLFLLSLLGAAAPLPLKQADTLFNEERYEAALKPYEDMARTATGETKWTALYRAIESEGLLFRYTRAVERAFSFSLPSNPLWRARFILLQAETAREYLKQYGEQLPTDPILGSADISSRTPKVWHSVLQELYSKLFPLRDTLLARLISNERYFVPIDKKDLERLPTLWDFAVERWASYLLEELPQDAQKLDFKIFWVDSWTIPKPLPSNPALLAAALFEESSRKSQKEASELWKLKRYLIPLDAPHWIRTDTTTSDAKERLAGVLTNLSNSFKTPRAQAEALWQAAQLESALQKAESAVKHCRRLQDRWPQSPQAFSCYQLRTNIELPLLSLETQTLPSPLIKIEAKNVPQIYFRLYRTNLGELKSWKEGEVSDYLFLRHLPRSAFSHLVHRLPLKEWALRMEYPKKYHRHSLNAPLPSLEAGSYVVLASSEKDFKLGESLVVGTLLHVSPFYLHSSTSEYNGKQGRFYFTLLDRLSGEPVPEVSLTALVRKDYQSPISFEWITNSLGRSEYATPVVPKERSWSVDTVAIKEGTLALPNGPLSLFLSSPPTFKVFIDSDRPIYRPGQEIRLRITGLKQRSSGWDLVKRGDVSLVAKDPNDQVWHESNVELNSFGSAVVTLTIPSNRLLGQYTLEAILREKDSEKNRFTFLVEEYKRPEFEVTLQDPDEEWRYGSQVHIRGNARYYSGPGIPQGQVQYRIYREPFLPWFFTLRHFNPTHELVLEGASSTDKSGNFNIPLKLEAPDPADSDPLPSYYSVEVSVTSTGGQTVTRNRRYQASLENLFVKLEAVPSFITPTEKGTASIAPFNLDGTPTPSRGTYRVHEVRTKQNDRNPEYENLKLITSGNFQTTPDKPTFSVTLPTLPAGIYRLTARSAKNKNDSSLVFISWDPLKPPRIPSITVADKPEYEVGETARVVLGSSNLKKFHLEIWRGKELVSHQLLEGGVREIQIPVEHAWRGGFSIRWFGIYQSQFFEGVLSLDVPWSDKKLDLKFSGIPQVALPGEKIETTVTATHSKGKGIQGEGFVRIYDESLEGLASTEPFWIDFLFPKADPPPNAIPTLSRFFPSSHYTPASFFEKQIGLEEPKNTLYPLEPPRFRIAQTRHSYFLGGRMMRSAESIMLSQADTTVEKATPIRVRKNFVETAYFNGQLPFKDGKASISFQLPDTLTRWKFSLYALTDTTDAGKIATTVLAQKPLTVRLQAPRYFREGDRVTIRTTLRNETEEPIQATALFEVDSRTANEKTFTLSPQKEVFLNWPFEVAKGLTQDVKLTASIRSSRFSDSEDKQVPVLPSQERFINSQTVSLEENSSKTLNTQLPKDSISEAEVLQIDPNLFLSLVQSLPSFVNTPYDCTDAILARFLPLAILAKLYEKYPFLKEKVSELPKRQTLFSPWDKKDPRQLLAILETPWVQLSQGLQKSDVFDLFNPEKVRSVAIDSLGRLKERQLPDGSFPWFKGAPADPFMTLYALASFGRALDFGVKIPEEMLKKTYDAAYALLDRLDTKYNLPMVVLSTYSLSRFWNDYSWSTHSKSRVEKWLSGIESYKKALTPLGKAYLAHVYKALGHSEKAESYLGMALDGVREDEVTGVYWTPEERSWLWYQDTIDKHAFFIHTLLKWKPDDPKLKGMVKWLLFNRKGSQWKSFRSSSEALYSLADYFEKQGSFEKYQKFSIKAPALDREIAFQGGDILEDSFRLNLTRSQLPVEIRKEGPGIAFASLTSIFSTNNPSTLTPQGNLLKLRRNFYTRSAGSLRPLTQNSTLKIGDEIEEKLTVTSHSGFEYLYLKAPRPSGLEPMQILSGWKWDEISRYEEPRDSMDRIFFNWVPHGEFTLRLRLRATHAGEYALGPAVLQSLYAPELAAYSDGWVLRIAD